MTGALPLQTMHSILKVGPYDWDPAIFPRNEFVGRIRAFWAALPDPSVRGALVYGDSRRYAALAYLTGFTPKVRMAMAFVPRNGEPVMLVPGSKAGLSSARKLTWVEKVELLSDPRKALAESMKELGGGRIALLGGQNIRSPLYEQLEEVAGGFVDADAFLLQLMQRKAPRELAAIGKACELLATSAGALRAAQRSGSGAVSAALAAEHEAIRGGAQDAQVLFSFDGGRTLRPFDAPADRVVDPLQAYVTVSYAGYWADALVSASASTSTALEKAQGALNAMLAKAKPGASGADLGRAAKGALGEYRLHPMTEEALGSAIGLTLDEPPLLRIDGNDTLQPGGVYSLKVGATDGKHYALVSAMVSIGEAGTEVLWASA